MIIKLYTFFPFVIISLIICIHPSYPYNISPSSFFIRRSRSSTSKIRTNGGYERLSSYQHRNLQIIDRNINVWRLRCQINDDEERKIGEQYGGEVEDGGQLEESPVGLLEASPPTTDRIFNFFLLSLCFTYALYTVVTIDSSASRGWTLQESLYRMPYDNWRNYEDALELAPVETKTTINVIIYLLGDWLSQTVFRGGDFLEFDAYRTMKNGLIGACFGPVVHLYYEWSDVILPVEVGINRVYKILMDQTLYLGVKCSLYIAAVGFLNGDDPGEVGDTVKGRIKPIMLQAWRFWPLIHCCTYSVIPARHRVLWVNCVDLFWNAILSRTARAEGGGGGIFFCGFFFVYPFFFFF